MRVLLVAGVDVALPGGVETHVRELAGGLVGRGHSVDVLGRASRPVDCRVIAQAAPADYDIVHHHAGPCPQALKSHAGLVHTLHFCVAAKMATYVRIGRLRTLANLANWRAVAAERGWARGRARKIAVSIRVRDQFARWHGLKGPPARVISNGYTPEAPAEPRATLRARYDIPETARVLLTVGRADFVKGYDLLERAWRDCGATARGAIWVTVGGSELSRSEGRLITGPLPHTEVASWIAASDVGALPSYYEGCSVALLEMIGGRLFTLAHPVGNSDEVIRPGDNGQLVAQDAQAWKAALLDCIDRPPVRAASGLSAQYTWPDICAATCEVYAEALA